ncbi:MAG: SPOR domain-containing protein [Chitinophagales bacterium]
MRKLLVFILIFFPLLIQAQTGSITVVQDSGVQKVLKLYQSFATEKRAVSGFRVQLASNSNRTIVMDLKSKFMQQYPEVNAYVVYQQPQFKLRVGDFVSRKEATKFRDDLRASFPTAFTVPDKIFVKGIPW